VNTDADHLLVNIPVLVALAYLRVVANVLVAKERADQAQRCLAAQVTFIQAHHFTPLPLAHANMTLV